MPQKQSKPAVALVKSPVRYDAVFTSLELVQKSVIDRLSASMRIVIKPDFFFEKQRMSTSVDSVRAVLDFMLEFTNKKITIAEGMYDGGNMQNLFHKAQLHALAEDYGLNFVALHRDGFVTIRLSDKFSVRVAKTILNSDFRVSLAVPKISGSNYSGALANLALGSLISNAKTLARNDKAKLVSSKHYDDAIAEILKVVRPSLAVVDGFESVANKKSVETNFCVASTDGVAADVVAAGALYNKLHKKGPKQKYLDTCGKAGLGQYDAAKIRLIGNA